MPSLTTLFLLAHLVGLSLAVGAATSKILLLIKSRSDASFVPVHVKASKTITKLIISGLVLLTLSGIGWILSGYPFTPKLVIKLVLVLAVWLIGPYIDNVVEPIFIKLASEIASTPSQEFSKIHKRYLTVETVATSLFYAIVAVWVVF
jgi:hypothetical protein